LIRVDFARKDGLANPLTPIDFRLGDNYGKIFARNIFTAVGHGIFQISAVAPINPTELAQNLADLQSFFSANSGLSAKFADKPQFSVNGGIYLSFGRIDFRAEQNSPK